MTDMQAFHGDPAIKDKYLTRVRQHREADNLIQGTGWEDGKGCAIGCTLEAYDHSLYPIELGIPVQLAGLEDAIFEGLPNGKARAWPERFLAAIRTGADLSRVWHDFAHWLLVDPNDGVIRFVGDDEQCVNAIRDVAALHAEYAAATDERWDAAWNAARYAARDAAWAAARAAAWAARYAAGTAARYAAGTAARYAAGTAARYAAGTAAGTAAWAARYPAGTAAWAAAYVKQADKLITLLEAA